MPAKMVEQHLERSRRKNLTISVSLSPARNGTTQWKYFLETVMPYCHEWCYLAIDIPHDYAQKAVRFFYRNYHVLELPLLQKLAINYQDDPDYEFQLEDFAFHMEWEMPKLTRMDLMNNIPDIFAFEALESLTSVNILVGSETRIDCDLGPLMEFLPELPHLVTLSINLVELKTLTGPLQQIQLGVEKLDIDCTSVSFDVYKALMTALVTPKLCELSISVSCVSDTDDDGSRGLVDEWVESLFPGEQTYAHLKRLEISVEYFPHRLSLSKLFSKATALEDLTISLPDIALRNPGRGLPPLRCLRLKEIKSFENEVASFCDHFIRGDDQGTLETLTLAPRRDKRSRLAQRFPSLTIHEG